MTLQIKTRYTPLAVSVKSCARAALMGRLKTAVGANISYLLIRFVIRELAGAFFPTGTVYGTILTEIVSFIGALLLGIFTYGLFYVYMNFEYDQPVSVSDLFTGFRQDSPDRIIRVQAFLSALEILCMVPFDFAWNLSGGIRARGASLFLVIAAAVLGIAALAAVLLNYGLCFYILIDFRDPDPRKVLTVSRRIMRGHRLELLYLTAGFIPLYLAGLLSFGIANLWTGAYYLSTVTAFYRRLVGKPEDPLN